MATKEKFNIGNNADAGMLWNSSGNEFDGLDQAIEELIDDAYSNFEGNQCISKTIVLELLHFTGVSNSSFLLVV